MSLMGLVGGQRPGRGTEHPPCCEGADSGKRAEISLDSAIGMGLPEGPPPRGKAMHRIGVRGAPLYPKGHPRGRGGAEVWGCAVLSLSPFWPYNDVTAPRREFWGFFGWEVGDQ